MSLKHTRIPTFRGSSLALSGLVDGAVALGAAAAQRSKKAVPPNPPKQGKAKAKKGAHSTTSSFQTAPSSMTRVHADLNSGVKMNTTGGGLRHSPFRVKGSSVMASLSTNSTNMLIVSNAGGSSTSTLKFSVDPVGGGVTAANFFCIPDVIRNICLSFVRHRWHKFRLTYVPVCPTTTSGQIVMASSPEVVLTSDNTNYGTALVTFSRNCSTPVWSAISFDAHGHDGIDGNWYYTEALAVANEATLRQECAGSLFFGSLGTLPASTPLGYIRLDFELELEALQSTALFSAALGEPKDTCVFENKAQSSGTAIEQPSVVVPQLGQAVPPPTPEHTYVYVPGNQRYTPHL